MKMTIEYTCGVTETIEVEAACEQSSYLHFFAKEDGPHKIPLNTIKDYRIGENNDRSED